MILSVIVPVYNVEEYLDRCINSIVNQTMDDIEIILVDDGSTDSSGLICDSWEKKDDRVVVLHKKNGGLSSARNAGIDIAQGDILSFIDSDDSIDFNMYEIMIDALIRTGKDIVCCGRIVDLWGKREKEEFTLKREKIYSKEESIKEILLLKEIDVAVCDKIFRKDLFKNIKFPEGEISEDAAVIFELVNNSNGIVHIGKPFYHYFYRKKSISKSAYSHKKYDAYINCLRTEVFINKNYSYLNNCCKIYCTQICGGLLQSMMMDKEIIKKYKDDFKKYKEMFNEGFLHILLERRIPWKDKIRYSFVRLNIYVFFEKIKRLKYLRI